MAEYQIEISGPRNEYVFFPPVPSVVNHRGGLRGRWDFGKTAHRDKDDGWIKEVAFSVQQIPGIVIAVSEEKMLGVIYDPLGTKEFAHVLQQCNEIRRRFDSGFELQQPWPKVERKLDAHALKDWLYWMRRILDRHEAVLVSGSAQLPALEKIQAMPGRRRADPFYTGQATAKSADQSANFGTESFGLYPHADEVPLESGRKTKESTTA